MRRCPTEVVRQSFDPWAPEGVYARRQREREKERQKTEKVKRRKNVRDTEASRNADEGPRNEDMKTRRLEPVLKKRGPMSAVEYEELNAVPGDDLDQQVQSLARHSADALVHVSGEVVQMAWHSTVGPPTAEMPQGQIHREVFVFVDSPDAENDVPGEPLHLYLRPNQVLISLMLHSANVAYAWDLGHVQRFITSSVGHFSAEPHSCDAVGKRAGAQEGAGSIVFQVPCNGYADLPPRDSIPALSRSLLRTPSQEEDGRRRCPPSPAECECGSRLQQTSTTYYQLVQCLQWRPFPATFKGLKIQTGKGDPVCKVLPPALPGPGGSFLLPPSAGLDFLNQGAPPNLVNPFMPQGRPNHSPLKTPGSSSTAPPSGPGSLGVATSTTFPAGSFYSAGLGPHGGSFLGVGGSFLMTNGMQASWGSLPRTGSNVQVGMPPFAAVGEMLRCGERVAHPPTGDEH
eukprot:Skav223422  [mRNA]  locus=scaffold350:394844:404118:+ [translate_table: standard]